MASVYGRKVKEPKVTARGTLPMRNADSQVKDLEKAWANFGEAKSALQRLERDRSPPLTNMNSTQTPYLRRPGPHKRGVKFESGRGARGRAGISRDLEVEDIENKRGRRSEYTLEPEALNEKVEYDTKSPSRPHTSPYLSGGSARKYAPQLSASRSVQFTPTPFSASSTSSSSLPVSSSSYTSPPRASPAYSRGVPSTHHPAPSPSTAGAVGTSLGPVSSSHSNAGAVFGKSPKFGSWDKSRPTLEGAEHPQPYSTSVPSSSSALSIKPSTATMNLYPSSSAHSVSSSTHQRMPVWTSPLDKQVPLRGFEVPAETLRDLKANVSEKRKVAKVPSWQKEQPAYGKPGASETATSRAQPHPPSFYSYGHEEPHLLATKRRKVAPVQPPRVYAGFSSTDVTQGVGYDYQPRHTRSTRYGGTTSTGVAGKGGYAAKDMPPVSGVKVQQYSRSKFTTRNPTTVRKVHRMVSDDGRDVGGDIITPSSWRVGKELAERILKAQQQVDEVLSDSTMERSSSTTSHLSIRDSLNSTPSHTHHSFSDSSLHVGEPKNPAAPLSSGYQGATVNLDEASEPVLSRGSVLEGPQRATQLSSDVDKLLEDLRAEREDDVKAGEELGGLSAGFQRKDAAVAGRSATMKTKHSYEPSQPEATKKARHYDSTEVQHYIQQKKEERRRRSQEEQRIQEQVARERQQKLKTLYETQRRRVEANLRLKQKQREAWTRAESAVGTGIHIHVHDSSESDLDPVPRIKIQSPPPTSSSSPYRYSHHYTITSPRTSPPSSSAYHHPSHPRTTTPPRYSSFHTPRASYSPPRSRRDLSPHSFDHSPHRRDLLPCSRDLSPHRRNLSPHSHDHSPRSRDLSPRTYSVLSDATSPPKAKSPRRAVTTPVTSEAYTRSLSSHHKDTPIPTSRGYAPLTITPTSRYGTTPTHASTRPEVPFSSSARRLKGSEYVRFGLEEEGVHRSSEERLQAITAAALDLKERIMEQSQKLADAGAPESSGSRYSRKRTYLQSAGIVRGVESVPGGSGLHEHSTVLEDDLPGVGRLQEHAALVEKERQENEAARKIQATYRGYAVRKSLQWPLPAGGTLGGALGVTGKAGVGVAMPGARGGGDGGERDEESDNSTLTPVEEEEGVSSRSPTPTRFAKPMPPMSAGGGGGAARHSKPPAVATPPATQEDPWKRTGGDAHSIINVFTRHHKGVVVTPASPQSSHHSLQSQHHSVVTPPTPKQTLPQPHSSPKDSTLETAYSYTPISQQSGQHLLPSQRVTPPTPKRTPPHSTPKETTLETVYSYSQTFETASDTASETGRKEDQQEDGGSISEVFSQDSLASADSYGTYERKSVSARSSPHSASDHTLTTTPPRRKYGSGDSQSSRKSGLTRSVSYTGTQRDDTSSISAITPPGSPSFVESFASVSAPKLVPPLPPAPETSGPPKDHPRLPAHALEHQLQTELKVLETVEDSLQRVTQAESLAQQKLAQLMESAITSSGAHQRVCATMAQDIATSAASAAAREAVRQAMKHGRGGVKVGGHPKQEESGLRETSYNSDFEGTTTITEHTETPPHADHTPDTTSRSNRVSDYASDHTPDRTSRSDRISDHASDHTPTGTDKDISLASVPESMTPVPSEATPVPSDATPVPSERIVRSADDERESNEEVEEDISEVSFRQLLPSESHRRHQTARSKPRLSRSRNNSSVSDLDDRPSSPSVMGGSRPVTPYLSEGSLVSPHRGAGTTEDSFQHFMSRMVQQYVREEEVRARHQATLLQLRENALKEKTKAELDWLKLQQKDLKRKGADEEMPPLRMREKGLLKKLQQGQEEINTLKQVQEAARQERKLMLLQQKEISKMRRSTQYYREKIHKYGQQSRASESPDRSRTPVGASYGRDDHLSDVERESSVAPSEQLDESFPTYTRGSMASGSSVRSNLSTPQSKSAPGLGTSTDMPSDSRYITQLERKLTRQPQDSRKKDHAIEKKTDQTQKAPGQRQSMLKPPKKVERRRGKRSSDASPSSISELRARERLSERRRASETSTRSTRGPQSQEDDSVREQLSIEDESVREQLSGNDSVREQLSRDDSVREQLSRDDSVREQLSKDSSVQELSVEVPSEISEASPITSVVSKQKSISSVAEVVSDEVSETATSQVRTQLSSLAETGSEIATETGSNIPTETGSEIPTETGSKIPTTATGSKISSEYMQDTFESMDSTLTPSSPGPSHQGVVATSTPIPVPAGSESTADGEGRDEHLAGVDYTLSESLRLSESISETMTVTSDGSAIEARIRSLKQQLRQRKKEVKRVRNEQNRKRKEKLKQHEEVLKKRLEAMDSKVHKMKSPTAAGHEHSDDASSAHSHTPSELSESELSSRAPSTAPDDRFARSVTPEVTGRQPEGDGEEEGATPLSPRSRSQSPYTPFTESMESRGVSEALSTDTRSARTPSPRIDHTPEVDHTPISESHTSISESHTSISEGYSEDHTPEVGSEDHTPVRHSEDHTPEVTSRDYTPHDIVPEEIAEDVPEEEEEDLKAEDTLTESSFPHGGEMPASGEQTSPRGSVVSPLPGEQATPSESLKEQASPPESLEEPDEVLDEPDEVLEEQTPPSQARTRSPGEEASLAESPGERSPPVESPGERSPPAESPGEHSPPAESPGKRSPPAESPGVQTPPSGGDYSTSFEPGSASPVHSARSSASDRSELLSRSRQLLDKLRSSSDSSDKVVEPEPVEEEIEEAEDISASQQDSVRARTDSERSASPGQYRERSDSERSHSLDRPGGRSDRERSDSERSHSLDRPGERSDRERSDSERSHCLDRPGGRSDRERSDSERSHSLDRPGSGGRSDPERSGGEMSDSEGGDRLAPEDGQQSRERSDSERSDTGSMTATPSQGGDWEDQEKFRPGQEVLIANKIQGVVRFVGTTHFAPGVWVGVEIGVPKGRNDGSIQDHRYFTCEPKYGLFVPPRKLVVVGGSGSEEMLSVNEDIEHSPDASVQSELQNRRLMEQEDEEERSDVDEDTGISRREGHYTGIADVGESRSRHGSLTQIIEEEEEEEVEEEVTSTQKSNTSSELPAPASSVLETQGEKPDGMPLAPEVASQRSQSATPTPAPPPEFAEGASRESSIEPPSMFQFESHKVTPDYNKATTSERLSEEIVQDLTNEAYEAMHKIWRAKHRNKKVEEGEGPVESAPEKLEKPLPLSLDEKADQITNQLLALLLQSEASLACNIHAAKKMGDNDQGRSFQKVASIGASTADSPQDGATPRTHPVATQQSALTQQNTEPKSPTKRFHPAPLHITTSARLPIDSSPPPLSPPSPYRGPAPSEFSPPGSPPRQLPHNVAERLAAGERSPFSANKVPPKNEPESPILERSTSTESVFNLIESIKVTTAQCMVPSERDNVNDIVQQAWEASKDQCFKDVGSDCPEKVIGAFNNIRAMSPEEQQCQSAYVKLVYRLALETIRSMCPQKQKIPIWAGHCTVRSLLAPTHFTHEYVPLEEVQRRVYASLMRGQLPSQLPAVKFLHKMQRPGGREIDFVDQLLIRDLRGEEPGWVDYSKDEVVVKEKTADALLEALIDETVGVLKGISEKRRSREQHLPSRTPT